MRRPHRNIEIFSMSVLDMFASALGAFIMCAVILFPYYKKDVSKELADAKAMLDQKSRELDTAMIKARVIGAEVRHQGEELHQIHDAQAALSVCKNGLNQCQVALAKNFLLVEIMWHKNVNVDLHVIDAHGNEFFWRKTNRCGCEFPGTKAELSVDSFGGSNGGLETWIDPQLEPGIYKIEYVMENSPAEDIPVTGVIIDRTGAHQVQEKSFASHGADLRILGAELQISDDGFLTIR